MSEEPCRCGRCGAYFRPPPPCICGEPLPPELAPGDHRVLSLRQPWAWMVVYGTKNIENRPRRWNYRGRVLVHAASEMTRKEYRSAELFARERGLDVPSPSALRYGGIIGTMTIVDCLAPVALGQDDMAYPWHMPELYGYILEARGPLAFVPLKGQLGIFHYTHSRRRDLVADDALTLGS